MNDSTYSQGELNAETAGMLMRITPCFLQFFLPTRDFIAASKSMIAQLEEYLCHHPAMTVTGINSRFERMRWPRAKKSEKMETFTGVAFFAHIILGLKTDVEKDDLKTEDEPRPTEELVSEGVTDNETR